MPTPKRNKAKTSKSSAPRNKSNLPLILGIVGGGVLVVSSLVVGIVVYFQGRAAASARELEVLLSKIPERPATSEAVPVKMTAVHELERPELVWTLEKKVREATAVKSIEAANYPKEYAGLDKEAYIEVTGVVTDVTVGGFAIISLASQSGQKAVRCQLAHATDPIPIVSAGQVVKLKGKIFRDDHLMDCLIVEVGPNPAIIISTDELGRILEHAEGGKSLVARLAGRSLIFTGKLSAAPKDGVGKFNLGPNWAAVCKFYTGNNVDKMPVGTELTVHGCGAAVDNSKRELTFSSTYYLVDGNIKTVVLDEFDADRALVSQLPPAASSR